NVRNSSRTDFDGKDTTMEMVQGLLMSITNPSCTMHPMNQSVMKTKRWASKKMPFFGSRKNATCTVDKTVEIPLRHFVPCGMVRVYGL
ncbi:MAG: hypothetical protein II859_04595, partial [Bacteroidales bacterium]|nr:hypothetical protein [Bacteroidales bacterium]